MLAEKVFPERVASSFMFDTDSMNSQENLMLGLYNNNEKGTYTFYEGVSSSLANGLGCMDNTYTFKL